MKVLKVLALFLHVTLAQALRSEYYDAFAELAPFDLRAELYTAANPDLAVVEYQAQNTPYLYAGRYTTVEELCDVLFGDLEELRQFNVDQPHVYYSEEEYREALDLPVSALTEQLVSRAWITLFRVYQKYIQIFDTLERLSEKDYVDIFDHITGKDTENYFEKDTYYGEGEDFDIGAMSEEEIGAAIGEIIQVAYEQVGMKPSDHITSYAEIPFISLEDYTEYAEVELPTGIEDPGDISSQGLSIIKIPLLIIKLILIAIWDLIELKKLIELAEVKSILLLFKLLKKICSIIRFIKNQIVFEIRVIIWTIKTKKPLYKAISVIFLIIKKLRQLAWILQDAIYRYRWKIYFVFRRLTKKSLAVALWLKLEVYGKLGIPTKEEKLYKPLIEKEDGLFDGDYFKTFAKYKYNQKGRETIPMPTKYDLQQMKESLGLENEQDLNFDDDFLSEDKTSSVDGEGEKMFDMKEEYGFDSVKLGIDKLEKEFKGKNPHKWDKHYKLGKYEDSRYMLGHYEKVKAKPIRKNKRPTGHH